MAHVSSSCNGKWQLKDKSGTNCHSFSMQRLIHSFQYSRKEIRNTRCLCLTIPDIVKLNVGAVTRRSPLQLWKVDSGCTTWLPHCCSDQTVVVLVSFWVALFLYLHNSVKSVCQLNSWNTMQDVWCHSWFGASMKVTKVWCGNVISCPAVKIFEQKWLAYS